MGNHAGGNATGGPGGGAYDGGVYSAGTTDTQYPGGPGTGTGGEIGHGRTIRT